MKTATVLGAGGFIGSHLVKRLKDEGYRVTGIDLKYPEFGKSAADKFIISDLRDCETAIRYVEGDDVYQLAADMGGAGFVFTGKHDFKIMANSSRINLNCAIQSHLCGKMFFSSSACIYPERNQLSADHPETSEDSAYPAGPDSEYGWEKLYAERMYQAAQRNLKSNIYIARFHNIYGPEGTWQGGREKAPAAICRKVAQAQDGSAVKIWGDGKQTRSFTYIDDCLEGVRRLVNSDCHDPLNIGSDEMVSINELTELIIEISGKRLYIEHEDGPLGVRGRTSDNRKIVEVLGWKPSITLREGIEKTYHWINKQVNG